LKQKALKKALLLFVAEFVVWLLAGIVIGAVRGDWQSQLSNPNFLLLSFVFSAFSAFMDYNKNAGKK